MENLIGGIQYLQFQKIDFERIAQGSVTSSFPQCQGPHLEFLPAMVEILFTDLLNHF